MSATPSSSNTNGNMTVSKPANLSLNNQIILDEDDYTEGLSRIIARDFFPTLHHLTATNEYLTALDSQDPSLIQASVRTLRELGPTPVFRPGQTPLRTPARNPRNTFEDGPNKRRKYDDNMSLDDFQARYTSEDNASFTEILDDENIKRRERFKWAWDAQRKAMEGKMIEDSKRERMLIDGSGESDQRGVGVRPGVRGQIAIERPDVLLITQGESRAQEESQDDDEENKDDNAGENKQLALSSTPSEERDVMAPLKDTRTPYVSTWKFKNRNGLMFQPDADESPYHMQIVPITSSDSTNTYGGIREPKSISHASTRLPSPPPEAEDPSTLIPPSPTRSRIDAAIAGLPYISKKEAEAEGPNGYNYVPTLPSPSPDQLGPAALKELMTMGTLLSTPRLLSSTRDGNDDPAEEMDFEPTPFKINPPSRREQTGLRLSAKAGKSLREKAALLSGGARTPRTKGDMAPPPTVGFTPKRTASDLTPAARALLARSTAGKSGGSSTPLRIGGGGGNPSGSGTSKLGMERDLRKVKWTPSPITRR